MEPGSDTSALRTRVTGLIEQMSHDGLAAEHWPGYGALISVTRNIIDTVDDVASARPLGT